MEQCFVLRQGRRRGSSATSMMCLIFRLARSCRRRVKPVGAGLEYGFAPNWSVGIEYNHIFLGDRTIDFTTPAGAFAGSDRIRQDVDIGLVRLNYKFGGPTIARY